VLSLEVLEEGGEGIDGKDIGSAGSADGKDTGDGGPAVMMLGLEELMG
jgi:hypothetical protein